MNVIPDYTDHLNSRMEAAARTRQSFENKMQPTIHVQLQVRKIVAEDYKDAAVKAMYQMVEDTRLSVVLEQILGKPTIGWHSFADKLRVAREVDGTYTVTLP